MLIYRYYIAIIIFIYPYFEKYLIHDDSQWLQWVYNGINILLQHSSKNTVFDIRQIVQKLRQFHNTISLSIYFHITWLNELEQSLLHIIASIKLFSLTIRQRICINRTPFIFTPTSNDYNPINSCNKYSLLLFKRMNSVFRIV